jgi:hypothetical protein
MSYTPRGSLRNRRRKRRINAAMMTMHTSVVIAARATSCKIQNDYAKWPSKHVPK